MRENPLNYLIWTYFPRQAKMRYFVVIFKHRDPIRGEKSLIVEHVLKCYDLWADRVYRGQKSREFNDMSSGKLT